MCGTCGCDEHSTASVTVFPDHDHVYEHADDQLVDPELARTVVLERQILAKNDLSADNNRVWLTGRGILAINIMSSPGSGKTTLLERTIRDVGDELVISVIEGDQESPLDARRIQAAGRPVVQVNTGSGCHLDADMVRRALRALDPTDDSVVFIENVGNLVCPALFDLGETHRIVIASVTEGADKPLKYPHMFKDASLVLINKVDLAPYVDFDLKVFLAAVRSIHPTVEVLTLSATRGDGLLSWYSWIGKRRLTLLSHPSHPTTNSHT